MIDSFSISPTLLNEIQLTVELGWIYEAESLSVAGVFKNRCYMCEVWLIV